MEGADMIPSGRPFGRTVEIDLSSGKAETYDLDPAVTAAYLGGNGIGVRALWDRVPPQTEPLSPEALLIFATGPLTGTGWPCSSRMEAIARSPLTGIYGDSNAGGTFGPALRFAGFDVVILKGASENPVVVGLREGRVELRDARHLWGRDTLETEAILRDDFGSPSLQVAAIGPAGEHLVRFASIQSTPNRSFGRCGLGAVMGAKRIKALAVEGRTAVPIADRKTFTELSRSMHARIRSNPMFPAVSRLGTPGLVRVVNEVGRFPSRNFQNGEFECADAISGEALHDRYFVRDQGCFACPVRCDKLYRVDEGPFRGLQTSSVEYETLNALGAGVGSGDLPAILAAGDRCDRLGLDTISTGRAISFAMELYENGILDRGDLDGLDGSWGNQETVRRLIEAIAFRRGIGDLLADGVRRAAKAVGGKAEAYAMEIKGMEIPAQDGRAQQSMGLAHAVSNRGADHLKAFPTIDETGLPDEVARRYGAAYLPEMADPHATRHKPFLVKDGEDFGAVVDSVGVCKSGGTFVLAEVYWPELAAGLKAAVGGRCDEEELRTAGERIVNLMRGYNARLGITRVDDRLPRRFVTEPSPARGARGEVAHAEEMLDEYYALRGWDAGTGWPTRETLDRLGLSDVKEALWGGAHE
jgi:aldehyde:ferredoxin oxidoreductase